MSSAGSTAATWSRAPSPSGASRGGSPQCPPSPPRLAPAHRTASARTAPRNAPRVPGSRTPRVQKKRRNRPTGGIDGTARPASPGGSAQGASPPHRSLAGGRLRARHHSSRRHRDATARRDHAWGHDRGGPSVSAKPSPPHAETTPRAPPFRLSTARAPANASVAYRLAATLTQSAPKQNLAA